MVAGLQGSISSTFDVHTYVDPKSVKRCWQPDWVLTLWGATGIKAVGKYVVEIDPWLAGVRCLGFSGQRNLKKAKGEKKKNIEESKQYQASSINQAGMAIEIYVIPFFELRGKQNDSERLGLIHQLFYLQNVSGNSFPLQYRIQRGCLGAWAPPLFSVCYFFNSEI